MCLRDALTTPSPRSIPFLRMDQRRRAVAAQPLPVAALFCSAIMSTKRKQSSAGVDSRALLRTLLDKHVVTDTLSRAASSKDTAPAELERILAALADAGVPVAAYRAQMASPVLSHCVRCHEQYDPLKNTPRSCRFAHEEPEWSEDEDTGAGYRKYPCCNQEVDESL
jgi:cytochrome c553